MSVHDNWYQSIDFGGMAETTRENRIAAAGLKFQNQMKEPNDTIRGKSDQIASTLVSLQSHIMNLSEEHVRIDSESIMENSTGSTLCGNSRLQTLDNIRVRNHGERQIVNNQSPINMNTLPWLDFPKFNGSNPRSWIIKCERVFELLPDVPDQHKVILASSKFEGRAADWFQRVQQVFEGQIKISCERFLELIALRFEDSHETEVNREFSNLKQTCSYAEYVQKFEELKARMLSMNKTAYSEEYFVAGFIRGLSEEDRGFVSMFAPQTLFEAEVLGSTQHQTREAMVRSDLCHNGDEAIIPGHECKNMSTHMVVTDEEELFYSQDTELKDENACLKEIHSSVHASTKDEEMTTMKLRGKEYNHELSVLDSESTRSLLQEDTTGQLDCYIVFEQASDNLVLQPYIISHAHKDEIKGAALKLLEAEAVDGLFRNEVYVVYDLTINIVFDRGKMIESALSSNEYWYNIKFHFSLKITVFQSLFGFTPTRILDYMQERIKIFRLLKENLILALQRSKANANTRIEDNILSTSLVRGKLCLFLLKTRCGSFTLLERIGLVTYKLGLPLDSHIHSAIGATLLRNVLHSKLLLSHELPAKDMSIEYCLEPAQILGKRLSQRMALLWLLTCLFSGRMGFSTSPRGEKKQPMHARRQIVHPWGQGCLNGGVMSRIGH